MRWYPDTDGPRNFTSALDSEIAQYILPGIRKVVEETNGTVSSIREVIEKLSVHTALDSVKIAGSPLELFIVLSVSTKSGKGWCQLLRCEGVITLTPPPGQLFDLPDSFRRRSTK